MSQPPSKAAGKTPPNAYRAAFERATNVASSEQTMERCAEVESAVEALRIRYEQFFLGLTRLPPAEDHKWVRSAVLKLRAGFVRNTSARFRVQSLHNRFLSYERLWQRTMREIEEGTYRRDLFKLRRRNQAQGASPDDQRAAGELAAFKERLARDGLPSDGDDAVDELAAGHVGTGAAAIVATPTRPTSPARRQEPPPARVAGAEALQEARLRKLYEAYVGAKRRCRESTDGLSYESLANSLRKQVPQLLAEHNASSVDFKVVIKGGKAVLKALPRQGD